MPIVVYTKITEDLYERGAEYETRQEAMRSTADRETGTYLMIPFLQNEEVPRRLSEQEAEMQIERRKKDMGQGFGRMARLKRGI